MDNFKLRFSDIFRYIILGAVEFVLCYLTLNKKTLDIETPGLQSFKDETLTKITQYILGSNDAIITIVLALSLFYLIGYLTQMIIQLFCKGNLMGTGLGEVGLFIKKYPTNKLNRHKYPHWLYYSLHPDKVLEIYREILETGNDSEIKTEFLYANNLFQGIALSLVIFSIYIYFNTIDFQVISISIIVLSLLCILGYFSVKSDWVMLINKSLIIIAPSIILTAYYLKDMNENADILIEGSIIGSLILICLCIAEQLSRRQIVRLDILIKYGNKGENEPLFMSTLQRNGVPTAFVLTRISDGSFKYYREQIESISNQIYPNIKVIVLIDKESKKHDDFVKIIETYRKDKGLNISHYTSEGTGPASLAYEIREIFLNYASKDDVAISLDGDDLFASRHVISRIMGRIARTKANICLLTFEFFGDSRLNYAKNYPNEIVKCIAEKATEKGRATKPFELIKSNNAHLISTIGWTKCYRKEVICKYQKLWEPYKQQLNKLSKYEDFPDIIALLSDDSLICAVGRTSILFRKHSGSITSSTNPDTYNTHVTGYLDMTMHMCNKTDSNYNKSRLYASTEKILKQISIPDNLKSYILNKLEMRCHDYSLSSNARNVIINQFIPYKFLQYLNIVRIKTSKPDYGFETYSPKIFYEHFVKKVYENQGLSKELLDQGIIGILQDNHKLVKTNRQGYYGNDLPAELNKETPEMKDVIKAFNL